MENVKSIHGEEKLGQIPAWWTVLFWFSGAYAGCLATGWLLTNIIDRLFGVKIFNQAGGKTTAIIFLAIAVISAGYVLVRLYRALWLLLRSSIMTIQYGQPANQHVETTLIADLESAYDQGHWEEVVKIGSVLSRPLWVTGRYKLRVRLGRFLEKASAHNKNINIQAATLIDDLGWTNFALGNIEEAKKNIEHGIRLAISCGDYYLAHKGERHLSGIFLEHGSLDEAALHHSEAEKHIEKLSNDDPTRIEAEVGLIVNKALIQMRRHEWESAYQNFVCAQEGYRDMGDRDREVKMYHFIGGALYNWGRLEDAEDIYREGLTESRKESRKDGILHNNLGIAKIALQEKDTREVRRAYTEALDAARDLGVEEKVKSIEGKLLALD